jgi:hypothetical protein
LESCVYGIAAKLPAEYPSQCTRDSKGDAMPNSAVTQNERRIRKNRWPLHPLAGAASLWLAAIIAFGEVAGSINMRERTFYASFFLAMIGAAWLAKIIGSSHVPESGYFAWIPVLLMLIFMGAPGVL